MGVQEDEFGDRADADLPHRALFAAAQHDTIERFGFGDFDQSAPGMAFDPPDGHVLAVRDGVPDRRFGHVDRLLVGLFEDRDGEIVPDRLGSLDGTLERVEGRVAVDPEQNFHTGVGTPDGKGVALGPPARHAFAEPIVRSGMDQDPAARLPPNRRVRAGTEAVRELLSVSPGTVDESVPPDVRKYERFTKVDGATYDRVNEFLRDRTYITAREWAIARLAADFRTETGIEMTKIGENLPELVPFMTDTYSPQAVNQARSAFEDKVRMAGATFLYGAMSGFFKADELDEIMYEATEVAKFLLEVEGVDLAVDEELEGEERISSVMREVREASEDLRGEEHTCPECGHTFGGDES